jgi:AcrR family transcriptional regulator
MTQADLTRQRLVRAALELFTAEGYDVTTTPKIAKKAGVAEGTIYRHFRSKQHLLNELYRAAARWATKFVAEAAAMHIGAREKLQEVGRGLAAGAAREPAIARLFFIQRHGELLDDESPKVARHFRLALEGVIAQGKADGSVKPGAAELWAAVWLSVVTLAVERVSAREWAQDHASVQATIEAAWDAIKS